jgi:hypothetical protein
MFFPKGGESGGKNGAEIVMADFGLLERFASKVANF